MNKTNSNISGFCGRVLGKRVVDDTYVLCVLDGDPIFSCMNPCSIEGAVLGVIDNDTRMTLGTIGDSKTTDLHIGSDAGDDIFACIFTINQFNRFVERLNSNQMPQKGSPLDSLFITYGRCVNTLEQLSVSYSEAMHLMERRFFCKENQHTVNYIQLPDPQSMSIAATTENLEAYCSSLITAIQTFNTVSIEQQLESLTKELYYSLDSINNSKLFLADLFISMKEKITFRYYPVKITLPNNTQIIEYIQTRYYLFQIIQYFRDNINLIINTISTSSVDNAMNDIINYIDHNYMENLKLEGIATLFGYNSSYLGKTISAKIGVNFNTYLDQVRIRNAKELLETSDLKVYNIAARVGYKNVDAFHEKFKKATGLTPSEYKKTCNVQENEES
ncbi:MAG: helix-turn-helix domain-containing protein [Clostridiales bacterium]|nr:helix-turn-helix domain-containing protein [Clostridiales bacterium]